MKHHCAPGSLSRELSTQATPGTDHPSCFWLKLVPAVESAKAHAGVRRFAFR